MARGKVAAMCAFGALLGVPAMAGAQWAVFDASNVVQTTQTALNTYYSLQTAMRQLDLMKQSLQMADPRAFTGVQNLFGQTQIHYDTLRNGVSSIGFAISDVNNNFDRLFPKDKTKWQSVRYSDYDRYYADWNAEITGSAKMAARAQAAIVRIDEQNRAIAQILSQSAGANGELRQLQLINQQLALIHGRLGELVQNLSTLGRVTTNMAASSASEKLLIREAKRRRREGYTDRGAPARVLSRLP